MITPASGFWSVSAMPRDELTVVDDGQARLGNAETAFQSAGTELQAVILFAVIVQNLIQAICLGIVAAQDHRVFTVLGAGSKH